MAKKVAIVGAGSDIDYARVVSELEHKGLNVVVIGNEIESKIINTIEVNGVKYKEKEKPERPKINSHIFSTLLMYGALDGMNIGGSGKQSIPKVDIVKEYGLIQQKKSLLSRSERESVIAQFNRKYEQI